jgi:predicted 2-oxoglutarate/Fe(II)-dependent dioxygenase YbiX
VRKTFHFDCTRIERFVVACYDSAMHGFFGPHRDNTTTATAHRIFAMTLNLNTEEYEGGHLRFPEYAPHRYRPPTGGAIVFSGSMLHEALPVTRGRRYALLSFFYGEAQEKLRRAYVERHGKGFETVDRNAAVALPGAETSEEVAR